MDTLQRNIITSDGVHYTFPQWKIESSRVLHTKQLWQAFKEKYKGAQPAPLLLKTIPSHKLKRFSKALETKNFAVHFANLNPQKQQDLICVAGKSELDSPIITINLIEYYFSKDFLLSNIFPLISIFHIASDLQRSVIVDNCKIKNFENVRCQEDIVIDHQPNGDCSRIPVSLAYDGNYVAYLQTIFNTIKGESYFIDKIKNVNKSQYYQLTYHKSKNDGVYDPNTRELWLTNADCSQGILKKVIKHTNEIDKTVFSNDAKFLITTSFPLQAELILTDLSLESSLSDTFLSGHGDKINDVCFNEQSTLLAVASNNGIQLWDIPKKSLVKIFDDCINQNSGRCTFGPNNLFAACTEIDEEIYVKLWNLSDISSIQLISSINFKNSVPRTLRFDLIYNSLIVMAPTHVVLIDTDSGKVIMETEPINKNTWTIHAAVLMPYVDILATTLIAQEPICHAQLWDTRTGILLATLLENQKDMIGVGNAGRKIITLFQNNIIETHLYNEETSKTLNWIDGDNATLLQRYLLERFYRAYKNQEGVDIDPDSHEYTILENLPTEPQVKDIVQKYLLSKK